MKNFRINVKQLSLTYPQCNLSKEKVLEFLQDKLQSRVIKEYLIVQEIHEDGNPHIHCFICLEKEFSSRSPTCLDILDFHGNYQGTKNKQSWIEYLLKSDKEPLQSIDWKEWLRNTKDHKLRTKNIDFLSQALDIGPEKMVEDGRVSLTNYLKLKQNLDEYKKNTMEDSREQVDSSFNTPWNYTIRWDSDLKQSHFWIYSRASNFGKTTFVQELLRKYRAELWNPEEKYQPQIKKETEMILFDEYSKKTCLTIGLLNQIMDGTVYITGKGMHAWKLNNKPLVIIFSNFSPSDVYSMTPNLPNLMSRIKIVDLALHHEGFN